MALPQQNRLRSNRDFSRVHRKGKRAATRHLAVRALKNEALQNGASLKQRSPVAPTDKEVTDTTVSGISQDFNRQSANGVPFALLSCEQKKNTQKQLAAIAPAPRFGISISRKVSKRAVVRNRIKRQLKAIIRGHFMNIDPAWQVVIVVRPPAVECSFDEFLRELEYLLQKLAITKR